MIRASLTHRLMRRRFGRCLANALLGYRARRRMEHIEKLSAGRAQARLLRGLVHRARNTRFGVEHNFHRIRSAEDFRRLVPLREPAVLWRNHVAPHLPSLENVLWPGSISYLASFDGPENHSRAPIPVTSALTAGHREALLTALALVDQARPRAELLSGSILLVGGDMALTPMGGRGERSTLEEWAHRQLPWWARPFTHIAAQSGQTTLESLAERFAEQSVTCLIGSPARLRGLWHCLRDVTGAECFRDVWPNLAAVIRTCSTTSGGDGSLAQLIDREGQSPPVLCLNAFVHALGTLAVEDPRLNRSRVLTDHGAYWELVPLEDLGDARPRRLGLADAVADVPYALALTAAGTWACLVGLSVRFDSVSPLQLRSVETLQHEMQATEADLLPIRTDAINPLPRPVGRPQNDDIPEARPRKLSRSPWSARADQR